MAQLKLQVRTVHHPTPRDVGDDEEGERLIGWVQRAMAQGGAPPVAATLRVERTDLFPLRPVVQARIQVPRFVGALTRSTIDHAATPYAVGVLGVVQGRRRGTDAPPTPLAVVFLEWPDNRWWYWKALVDLDGRSLRPGTQVVTRAVDGDPLPAVFGRWWSLARRGNLSIHLKRDKPAPSQIVH